MALAEVPVTLTEIGAPTLALLSKSMAWKEMVTLALPAPETVAVASVGVPTQTLALPAQVGVPKVTAVTLRSLAANSGQSLSVTAVHTCENGAPSGHVWWS